jgi:hypothetical protein
VPHSPQKRAPGAISDPQLVQNWRWPMAWPQLAQNLAPGALPALQLGHVTAGPAAAPAAA